MNKLVAIYGPTTSNKLGLALSLSKYIWGKYHIETEVINVDSRKIYKGFVVSQSLPNKSLLKKARAHLFEEIVPKRKLSLFEFQKLVKDKIVDVCQRNNLPVLVSGSSVHLRSVLENWKEGKVTKNERSHENILIFGIFVPKHTLRKLIIKNVSLMLKKGLYKEFKKLYEMSKKREASIKLLNETLGYRQFLEMAKVSRKSPLELRQKDFAKVKKWIIKDILNYGYHQTLDYKKFPNIFIIKNSKETKKAIDLFLQQISSR